MKKVYIIQDVKDSYKIICFGNLKSMKNYLNKFGYQFKELINSKEWDLVSAGTLSDIITDNGYIERYVYVRTYETINYEIVKY